ncbi:MAG: sialate O-acetylesterase, partial [Planctomycetota bacterium]|nr:sialate O-acetylesterase [Planctomycetota bacterium]
AATGDLYLANIAPMVPFAIRGVLWDQGESGTKVDRVDQFTLMGALIKGWRATWGQGDFPFIYVQKPSGGGCALDPASPVTDQSSKFAPLPAAVPLDGGNREVHIRIMQHPNTAMVIASDLGGGTHPTNKSGYGARAARVALGFAYGQKVEYYGPLYQGHKAEGGKIRVSFTHVGQGLTSAPGDKLQGFAIAGADRVYHWADAAIDGETVVLSSADVPHPVSVMYAYSTSIAWANLFNKDGLPAIPFKAEGK